jgi:AAA+ ATPase superfamily predicted ATPase
MNFINRTKELQSLRKEFEREGSSLYILYGRRRLGKTTLLREFSKSVPSIYYLADQSLDRENIQSLAKTIALSLNEPTFDSVFYPTWYSLFDALDRIRNHQKICLILDEYPYLCGSNPALSSILQKQWDEHWESDSIMVVLNGSALSMMYKETLQQSSPLFGRRTAQLCLQPFHYWDSAKFFPSLSLIEQVKMFSITGGIPYYCHLASRYASSQEALTELMLITDGPLRMEPKFLLKEDVTDPKTYWSLLSVIGKGANRISEIASKLGLAANQLTTYLSALMDMAYIYREIPITEKNPAKSKKGLYKIGDPFLKLWFSQILPYESWIEMDKSQAVWNLLVDKLPHHESSCFEMISKEYLQYRVSLPPEVRIGRYWDKEKEIDILGIDNLDQIYFTTECKWQQKPVGIQTYLELEEKTTKLTQTKHPDFIYYLFSGYGFTKELQALAKKNPIRLIGLEELYQQ